MENSGYTHGGNGGPNSTPINCKAAKAENHSRGMSSDITQEQYRAVCASVPFLINL